MCDDSITEMMPHHLHWTSHGNILSGIITQPLRSFWIAKGVQQAIFHERSLRAESPFTIPASHMAVGAAKSQ